MEPLVSGQQLITPEGAGDSGKAICSTSGEDSDCDLALVSALCRLECRALQQACVPIEADAALLKLWPDE